MHSAGGHQGSHKAHPAGNQKLVTKLKSKFGGRGINYFLELLGHYDINNINKDTNKQDCFKYPQQQQCHAPVGPSREYKTMHACP